MYTYEEVIALASSLGFSREEVEQRRQTTSQNEMMVELLLESSNRMPCYSKRKLGQVLMNHGHIKEALKLYPSGENSPLLPPPPPPPPHITHTRTQSDF